jgi:hypothetical protein
LTVSKTLLTGMSTIAVSAHYQTLSSPGWTPPRAPLLITPKAPRRRNETKLNVYSFLRQMTKLRTPPLDILYITLDTSDTLVIIVSTSCIYSTTVVSCSLSDLSLPTSFAIFPRTLVSYLHDGPFLFVFQVVRTITSLFYLICNFPL